MNIDLNNIIEIQIKYTLQNVFFITHYIHLEDGDWEVNYSANIPYSQVGGDIITTNGVIDAIDYVKDNENYSIQFISDTKCDTILCGV